MYLFLVNFFTHSLTATTFDDTTLEATPPFEKQYLQRDERLQKLHKKLKKEDKENRRSVQKLTDNYSKHHNKLINQKKQVHKQSNLQSKTHKQKERAVVKTFGTSPVRGRPSGGLRNVTENKYAAKLSAIYGSPTKKQNPSSPEKSGMDRFCLKCS